MVSVSPQNLSPGQSWIARGFVIHGKSPMIRLARSLRPLGAVSLFCLALGCSGKPPETTTVSGTVTYRDKPYSMATIVFTNDKGASASSMVWDGKFKVERVPIGENIRVTLTVKPFLDELQTLQVQYDSLPPDKKGILERLKKEGKNWREEKVSAAEK